MRRRLRMLLLVSATWAGCQYDPHAHLLTTSEPRTEDVVRTYVLDALHLPSSVMGVGVRPEVWIELRANGSFSATNLPPWTSGGRGTNFLASLVSGEGRWEKGTLGTIDGRKTIWGVYLRTPDDRFHPAGFTGDSPPYGLIFTLGDPDAGEAVLLKRRP